MVPAFVQLLWQHMLQICVHLHISACLHSCACGSGLPSVCEQSRDGPLQPSVCCSQLGLPSVRSPPHATTRRVTAGKEACPGGCTLPGPEWSIYGNLGHIFLVISSSEHRGIAVGLYHSQAPCLEPGMALPGVIIRDCCSPTALPTLLHWCRRSSSGLRWKPSPSGRPCPALQHEWLSALTLNCPKGFCRLWGPEVPPATQSPSWTELLTDYLYYRTVMFVQFSDLMSV